eukprot:3338641-Prymnesium_polylepis.1
MTQEDVLAGSALIFKGIMSLTELRAFKPRSRPIKIAHASTARMHAEQLNLFHVKQAALRVHGWYPQWDEGSKRGVTVVVVGANGLLKEVLDATLTSDDDFYRDALGVQVLSNKTGAGVSAAVISVLEKRGAKVFYFVGTDAVSSNIGHLNGVIAHLRKRFHLLIFVVRCGSHIIARSYKHMLVQTGNAARRSPIKRKAEDATIPAELLAIEDLYYIEKKWPKLHDAMQQRLPP